MLQILKPDVVFTDLKMPFLDGMGLIKAGIAAGVCTKYVIVSACEEFEMARQAISLGVKEYLVKPVTYDELKDTMERLDAAQKGKPQLIDKTLKERYPYVHPLVRKSLGFIEKGYSSKISQKELAANLGISQEYFCYLFNKDMGETFSHFLKNYRIEVAKKLLLNGELPKEEIPYSVGFSDSKYFNKVFREVEGCTMTEYIRKNSE